MVEGKEVKRLNKKTNWIRNNKIKAIKGEICVFCGCSNSLFLTIDHKTPLSRGGTEENKNLQVACDFCNKLKGSLNNQEFRAYLRQLKGLRKLNKIKVILPSCYPVEFRQDGTPMNKEEQDSWWDEWGEVKYG